MARMARVVVPGLPHHVTQRGNRKQRTFFNDSDFRLYRSLMAKYCALAGTSVWAYCLMPNHVHLVMVPGTQEGLKVPLAKANRHYSQIVNARNEWRGHLWQERFHSFPMDELYLINAVRYVERNPVSAGLCSSPAEWPWSSASAHLDERDDELVVVQPMLDRIQDWYAFLVGEDDFNTLGAIRRHARTGRPLGSDFFVAKVEALTGRSLQPAKRSRTNYSH